MVDPGNTVVGQFCWVDLAATDAARAKDFYGQVFGWTSCEQSANGGSFTRMRLSDRDVGSIYQLKRAHRDLPSHWTPYIRVDDVHDAVRRAVPHGGKVIIRPFVVSGIAQIALILDSVGAQVGLWEPIETNTKERTHG